MRSANKSIVIALAIAAAIAGTAIAEDQPSRQGLWSGWSWGPRGMMGNGFVGPGMGYGLMGPWMMGESATAETICNAMAGHIEGRLAFIKAELKVTDAQEPLWSAYAGAARDNAKTMIGRCTAMMGRRENQASLPDRLDQTEQLMTAHLDAVRAMNKALKPLYAALSDGQKKTADQLLWSPMGMM